VVLGIRFQLNFLNLIFKFRQAPSRLQFDTEFRPGWRLYLPVIDRQDRVAVLDKQGQLQGFLCGDGF
jgi:hypothetical protein